MTKIIAIWMLFLSFSVSAGNGGGKQPPKALKNDCKTMLGEAIDEGANAFTERMINLMADELVRMNHFENVKDSKACITDYLIKRRIPFEQ